MSKYIDVTNKYLDMIHSFECDFDLAKDRESGFKITELQELIDDNNEVLMKDIFLLEELSFGLRHNQIKIVEVKEDGNTTK